MKVLNLYAGIGGNRKLWKDVEVTAVEYNESIAEQYQIYFPNDTVIVADAHQYLLDHYQEFQFVWSSPPCTTHTRMNKNFAKTKNAIGQITPRYPDMKLYQEIIFLDNFFDGKYCVENVIPYYKPLIPYQQYNRHLYWCNFRIKTTGKGNLKKELNIISQKSKKIGKTVKSFIKEDNATFLAKKYGFDPLSKPIYINGNHSPGQVFRNCVDPKAGLMILDCARNIIRKSNTTQTKLF
jgi:DNA (cytosine-5)-methyltransferase 1